MMFIENKYTKLYFSIIENAKIATIERGELHHIIPKSLGGSNEPSNIVKLSFRQHLICHMLLVKITKDENRNKMLYALYMMRLSPKQYNRNLTSRQYEICKQAKYKIKVSEQTKNKMSISMQGKNKGKIASESVRQKMSDIAKNRKVSQLTKDKISKRLTEEWKSGIRVISSKFKPETPPMLGKTHSEETKLKQSLAAKSDPRRKLPRGAMSEETKNKISEKAKLRWNDIKRRSQ